MTRRTRAWGCTWLWVALVALAGCADPASPAPAVELELETVASGFEIPDALAVLGEHDYLFADRAHGLFHAVGGEVREVSGLPELGVVAEDLVLGGLLDVSLHPEFATNALVYIAYADAELGGALARFELRDDVAEQLELLWTSTEFPAGARIAWSDPEHLFLSFGAGGYPLPDPGPQELGSDVGKIHRLLADGAVPPDNPIFDEAIGPTSVWSYGHRNPQGLAWDELEQVLYANEHGPKGGDELNSIAAGGNYGWPLFSYGLNYDDTPVSDLSEAEAAAFSILPMAYWTPDFRVAPSGLLRLRDSAFEPWAGSFVMGALKPQHLLRYDPATATTEIVLDTVGRVRDVAQLPSGDLLIAIDADSPAPGDPGRLVRISPRP